MVEDRTVKVLNLRNLLGNRLVFALFMHYTDFILGIEQGLIMKIKYITWLPICLLLFFSDCFASISKDERAIQNVYRAWCSAVAVSMGNPKTMTKFYAPDAILLPTLSPKLLVNKNKGLDPYFISFTGHKNIKCATNKLLVQLYGDLAISSGLYTFTYLDQHGQNITLPARFNFVYKKNDGHWLIVNHHSSLLPKM